MDLKAFGEYVRYIRKRLNITQMRLSEMADCSLPTISKILDGLGYTLSLDLKAS